MSASVIDGKAVAARLRTRVAEEAAQLKARHGITPGLATVLVGNDPASAIYVGAKNKAAHEVGFRALDLRHPDTLSQSALLDQVAALNADPAVHGILVQMPLPAAIDPARIIAAIDPMKDVDGLTPMSIGRLAIGETNARHGLIACTPSGALMLIKDAVSTPLAGKDALVLGRSNQVGKPMAQLLLQENCTVTVAHSKTHDLPVLCRRADILVVAIGRAEMVRGDWIKPGAVVIDVGVNRKTLPDGKTKLVGDVAYAEVAEIAGAITPVPGGVGPMTIACLMRNTLIAAFMQAGLPQPEI
ncbi:MAG TPA: bifunctional methylenetetrahydrofolate dehydrogenase/methenyltetrahydrofolate cyclohydrolase FolD [Micropepsaceae bacterium]|nr:bifunctional methylenetetrahydrofolate dehydrogenase/methenyltetrahydrofolate cyclohydrolase FolD [Micropepsaceae bacterium]